MRHPLDGLVEIARDLAEHFPFGEKKEKLRRIARGGFNDCGEALWYVGRIWNNQEDR